MEAGAGGRNGRLTVVVADDDEDVRGLMARYLARPPFQVVGEAGDAEAAIELARLHGPTVALIDVNMPGGGAQRVLEGVREVSPATAIVILSALDEDSLVRGLLQAGAMAYLVKGAPRVEIVDTIQRAVVAQRRLSAG